MNPSSDFGKLPLSGFSVCFLLLFEVHRHRFQIRRSFDFFFRLLVFVWVVPQVRGFLFKLERKQKKKRQIPYRSSDIGIRKYTRGQTRRQVSRAVGSERGSPHISVSVCRQRPCRCRCCEGVLPWFQGLPRSKAAVIAGTSRARAPPRMVCRTENLASRYANSRGGISLDPFTEAGEGKRKKEWEKRRKKTYCRHVVRFGDRLPLTLCS